MKIVLNPMYLAINSRCVTNEDVDLRDTIGGYFFDFLMKYLEIVLLHSILL